MLERRPFRPHLTVARFRSTVPAVHLRTIVDGASNMATEQLVDSVTLYESRLSPDGAAHIVLASGELKGAASFLSPES